MVKNILSCSFGKDSLAMLLILLDKNYTIDEVVFVDTGMEFQAIYDIRDKVTEILKSKNIKYTELKFDKPFEYYMFEHQTKSGKKGYSWCGGVCRWGTAKKLQLLNKHCKGHGTQFFIPIADFNKSEGRPVKKKRSSKKTTKAGKWAK